MIVHLRFFTLYISLHIGYDQTMLRIWKLHNLQFKIIILNCVPRHKFWCHSCFLCSLQVFLFLFVCVRLFKVFKKIHCKNLLIATNQDFNIFFKVINIQTSTRYRCWKRKRPLSFSLSPQKQKLEAQPFILPKFEFSLVNRRLVVTYRHSILLLYHLIERLVFI